MGFVAFSVIQLIGIIVVMSQVAWQVFVVFIPVFATCVWYQVLFTNPAIPHVKLQDHPYLILLALYINFPFPTLIEGQSSCRYIKKNACLVAAILH
jgi:hypothetical protein